MTPSSSERPSPRRHLIIFGIVAATVLMAFLSWYSGWFGRALTDTQVEEALRPDADPRRTQHALEELVRRATQGDASVQRFRAAVAALHTHPRFEIRRMAAWVMGYDTPDLYRTTLRTLLADDDVGVRRMAACSLSKFGDASALPILREMLAPMTLDAPIAGKVTRLRAAVREPIGPTRDLLDLESPSGETVGVRPPFAGVVETLPVKKGDVVTAGQRLATLSPDSTTIENALVALALIGTRDDARLVEPYATGRFEGLPENVQATARRVLSRLR